jgi:hypothetical protein
MRQNKEMENFRDSEKRGNAPAAAVELAFGHSVCRSQEAKTGLPVSCSGFRFSLIGFQTSP